MRKVILFVAVVALMLWSFPAGAITNGESDGNRHPNVGAVVALYEGEYWRQCSGSLMSETQFLTAAHCINWIGAFGLPLSDLFVTFDEDLIRQDDGSVQPAHLIGVSDLDWHPAFRTSMAKGYNDVGVVTLAAPVTDIEPVDLPDVGFLSGQAASGDLRGHVFVNVGYGVQSQTKSLLNPQSVWFFDGHRSMSTSPFMALTPYFLKLLTTHAATGMGGIGWGDSGGPHFFSDDPTDPDYNLVVAVTAAGDPSLMALSENTRLDIPVVHEWLEGILGS